MKTEITETGWKELISKLRKTIKNFKKEDQEKDSKIFSLVIENRLLKIELKNKDKKISSQEIKIKILNDEIERILKISIKNQEVFKSEMSKIMIEDFNKCH